MVDDGPTGGVLVVRAWWSPDGPLLARIGVVTAPWHEPGSWCSCVGRDRALDAVGRWLTTLGPPPGD